MHHWQSKSTKNSTADDLVLLPKISHESITENLKKRFMDDCIYTYIGNVLIAVNPFKKLTIFTQKEIGMYQGAATYENPPHIYAIADNMFRNMMIDYESQCVIISGESGAGKTVSAKFIMEYISKVSGGAGRVEQIKEIILESNPLLEAFGNAKTVRNNNSSRFGKYVEIQFDRGGQPIGGKISQFLLEKSRVVLQNQNERNFHIFYQLVEGCDSDIREMFGVTTPDYYTYLNQSGVYKVDDLDDKGEFKSTMHAMEVMGLDKAEQLSILSIVAAVLHLGNMQFIEGQQQAEFKDKRSTQFPCYLLGIEESDLGIKMTSREMADRTNKDQNIVLFFNRQQAFQARDALSKALYARLFDFIVDKINTAMAINIDEINVGILDIYGFEIFVKNGFEQFCINYVNEKLQQIFIELTLKAEQEEYVSEGVKWTPVNYFNNKVVCDLIESKNPPGIFSILDDVCATAFKVTDSIDNRFVAKMDGANMNKDHYCSHNSGFTIFHYAGKVSYECEGFCERNRDQLSVDVIEMMQRSTNPFIVDLFPENLTELKNRRSTLTVGSRIRKQANDLVVRLTKCQPHYIRCIKPNETKRAKDWENERVNDQVTYLGLKENIIVRRAGYAYRRPFEKFMQRYAILSKETWPKWVGDVKKGIQHLMKTADINDGQWQIGKTKLFIKDPESLFLLEERRERKFNHYAKIIQIFFRRVNATKHYLKVRERAAELFYNKKERREFSLNRNFIGDYLFLDENPQLRILFSKREKVEFSSFVWKYDRRFKKLGRDLILTDKFVYLIGREKVKQGEKKGQFVEAIKRKLDISEINSISLSPYSDNFVIISVNKEYDSVLEVEFKTEFIMVLSKRFNEITNRSLSLKFESIINFTVKSQGFKGGSTLKITFVISQQKRNDVVYKVQGLLTPSMTVEVPRGLPSNTKPGNRDLRAIQNIIPNLEQRGLKIKRGVTKRDTSQNYMRNSQQNNRLSTDKLPTIPPLGKARLPQMSQAQMTPVKGAYPRQSQISDEELVKSAVLQGSRRDSNLKEKKMPPKPPRPTRPVKPVNKVEALYDYEATDTDEITIHVGDIIELVREDNDGWWTGKIGNRTGLMPSNYVKKI